MTTSAAAGKSSKQRPSKIAFGLRLDRDLVDRIDTHAAVLCARSPGLNVTRTDAVRVLLLAALDLAEAPAAELGRKSASR